VDDLEAASADRGQIPVGRALVAGDDRDAHRTLNRHRAIGRRAVHHAATDRHPSDFCCTGDVFATSANASSIAAVIRVPPQRGGWLEVVCGPMFSGKSEEMIRRLRRAEIAGQRVILFKPRIDDRYDVADVVSHAGVRMAAVPVDGCAELVARARSLEVVGIDEVQFFEPAIVDAALALADGGARVVVAGLDQDFRREPFGPMPELLTRAEFVDKLQAVCHRCGGPATTTQRLVDGRPAPYAGETIVVGALDSYEARCRDCHTTGPDAAAWLAA
jgi:thymidine kinase